MTVYRGMDSSSSLGLFIGGRATAPDAPKTPSPSKSVDRRSTRSPPRLGPAPSSPHPHVASFPSHPPTPAPPRRAPSTSYDLHRRTQSVQTPTQPFSFNPSLDPNQSRSASNPTPTRTGPPHSNTSTHSTSSSEHKAIVSVSPTQSILATILRPLPIPSPLLPPIALQEKNNFHPQQLERGDYGGDLSSSDEAPGLIDSSGRRMKRRSGRRRGGGGGTRKAVVLAWMAVLLVLVGLVWGWAVWSGFGFSDGGPLERGVGGSEGEGRAGKRVKVGWWDLVNSATGEEEHRQDPLVQGGGEPHGHADHGIERLGHLMRINDLIKKDDERDVDLPSRFTAFFPSASSLDEYD